VEGRTRRKTWKRKPYRVQGEEAKRTKWGKLWLGGMKNKRYVDECGLEDL